ncbi:MAG: prepilin-type N-terminal cleavage/methylation domain-containing protein [Gemmatimonadales bacterium]
MRRAGLTLLEVMVALVILSLVATGFLETFARALRATADARVWAQAVVYAEEGVELVKIDGAGPVAARPPELGGGFSRRVALRPWREGLDRATITITMPGGGQLALDRLVPSR